MVQAIGRIVPGGGTTAAVVVLVAMSSAEASCWAHEAAVFPVLAKTAVSVPVRAAAPGGVIVAPVCAPVTGTAVQKVATDDAHAAASVAGEPLEGELMAESSVAAMADLWPGVRVGAEAPNTAALA